MIINEIKQNIFISFENKEYNLLVHGCNCFNNMGAGIAAIISKKYPQAYKSDLSTIKGDKSKLGTYTYCDTIFGRIINMYTQYAYGYNKRNADYDAIKKGFKRLNEEYKGSKVCIPRIGAGLAKGDWNIIKEIINDSTPDLSIDVYWI